MKMRLFGFALFGFGISAAAMPVVVSSTLSLTADGYAGAGPNHGGGSQSYLDQQANPLAAGSNSVAVGGKATWSIPPPPGTTYPSTATAQSSASASTQLTTSPSGLGLLYTGMLAASIGSYVGAPVMHEWGNAAQSFSFVFQVAETSCFDLAFDYTAMHGHGMLPCAPQVSFVSIDGGDVIDLTAMEVGRGQWSFSGSGMLAPGKYRLTTDFSASVAGDPLGDFESGSFRTSLNTQAVPEGGSTLALLGATMGGVLWWKRRNRKLRHPTIQ